MPNRCLNYGLADCEKTYGKGSCERGLYTWGISDYLAVASPAKKGTNSFGVVTWAHSKAQAEKDAIRDCQNNAATWNAGTPAQLHYDPKDCKVIYNRAMRSVRGKKVKYDVYKNY